SGGTWRQINFAGTTQAIQSVVGGDVPVYVDGVAPLVPLVESGRLRALAVASDTKLPGLEDIPLAKDTVPGLVATGWFVLLAPKGTPEPILDRLHADLSRILDEPEFAARIKELGTYPMPKSRADALQFINDEKALWHGVIKKAGVKPN
nr:tripartite tricarboxylate transporter substrate binding protein [Pseudomonas sp.]